MKKQYTITVDDGNNGDNGGCSCLAILGVFALLLMVAVLVLAALMVMGKL